MNINVHVDYAGTIKVEPGLSSNTLFPYQREAVADLNKRVIKPNNQPFAGLLVLPTGGGKTVTAVQWALRNCVNNSKKVLWIAHRHELLDQAWLTFYRNAYANLLPDRPSFKYRLISGIHDRPVNIRDADDVIIASKDSLNAGLTYLLNQWLEGDNLELLLVVDEAHHAVAKTYRKLIDALQKKVKILKILGLTATPFRTAQNEQGLLKKVFVDDIVYKIDLRTLIRLGILSEPVFKVSETEFDMTTVLSQADLEKIRTGDIEAIGQQTAKTIAENSKRNNRIVSHYIENQAKYGQTLVFALNVDNAIALNKLFRDKKVASDYVVSAIRQMGTGVNISPEENKKKIDQFRKGELKVLINVNILTEGTDLPHVQTVFLTRPTISTTLMTQMIGRGLRGEKVGGTKNTFIVSFIDDWQDKIAWVNPERLFIEENVDFSDKTHETTTRLIRLISIAKIEEFARLMDTLIDNTKLERLDFIERIPVGLYTFSILKPVENSEPLQKNCEILVYDNIHQAYTDFILDLPEFFKINDLLDKEALSEIELAQLSQQIEDEYFYGCAKLPGYRREDIEDVLQYYALFESQPQFIAFEDRPKFDVAKVAKRIFDEDMGPKAQIEYLNLVWNDDQVAWQAFFGFEKRYFIREVNLALEKLAFPSNFSRTVSLPRDIKEQRDPEKLSMAELRELAPEQWRALREAVFDRAKDKDGYYTCARSNFKSKHKIHFQIDHIHPMFAGGLTRLDNLQLLTRIENLRKANRIEVTLTNTPTTAQGPLLPGTDSHQPTSAHSDSSLLVAQSEAELILISQHGFIKRVSSNSFSKDETQVGALKQDPVKLLITTNLSDTLLFFTNQGKVYRHQTQDIPPSTLQDAGVSIASYVGRGEKILAAISIPNFDTKKYLITLTRDGLIKRMDLSEFAAIRSGGLIALN